MDRRKITNAMEACFAVIKNEQRPDGGFLDWSSVDGDIFSVDKRYMTTFCTSNILSCLNVVPLAEYAKADLQRMRTSAAEFLLRQKSCNWSFNYWLRKSEEAKMMPYPDDLDDTFVALTALHGYDPSIINGIVLAGVTKVLTATEIAPGGPYRTWLVSPDAGAEWLDVDIVVNANLAHFLSLFKVVLPNLKQFIDERLRMGNIRSPYYPNLIQPIYFISRFYHGGEVALLTKQTMEILTAQGNMLEMAMGISSLINLGCGEKISETWIEAIITEIETVKLEPYAFCIDPSRDGKIHYGGSPALTAAFCAEALSRYAAWEKEENSKDKQIFNKAIP